MECLDQKIGFIEIKISTDCGYSLRNIYKIIRMRNEKEFNKHTNINANIITKIRYCVPLSFVFDSGKTFPNETGIFFIFHKNLNRIQKIASAVGKIRYNSANANLLAFCPRGKVMRYTIVYKK